MHFFSNISPGNAEPIRATWIGLSACSSTPCIADIIFAWEGTFEISPPTTFVAYEVSLGTVSGGSDIFQWVVTMESLLRVYSVEYQDLYITITAINSAGLYHTITQRVYSPPLP